MHVAHLSRDKLTAPTRYRVAQSFHAQNLPLLARFLPRANWPAVVIGPGFCYTIQYNHGQELFGRTGLHKFLQRSATFWPSRLDAFERHLKYYDSVFLFASGHSGDCLACAN